MRLRPSRRSAARAVNPSTPTGAIAIPASVAAAAPPPAALMAAAGSPVAASDFAARVAASCSSSTSRCVVSAASMAERARSRSPRFTQQDVSRRPALTRAPPGAFGRATTSEARDRASSSSAALRLSSAVVAAWFRRSTASWRGATTRPRTSAATRSIWRSAAVLNTPVARAASAPRRSSASAIVIGSIPRNLPQASAHVRNGCLPRARSSKILSPLGCDPLAVGARVTRLSAAMARAEIPT